MEIFGKYMLQETIDCDPSFETCDPSKSEVIEKPDGSDLFHLTFTVGALEVFVPVLSLIGSALLLFPDTEVGYISLLILLFPALAFFYPNLIWALLSLVYFIFGNNVFIFNWVDSTLVFVIQYLTSMLTPLIFIIGLALNLIYLFLAADTEKGIILFYLILYTLQAYAL